MKKKKVLVITSIILGLLALLLGCHLIQTLENNVASPSVPTTKLNQYLKNTALFSLKNEGQAISLIALDENGNETIIYDFRNYNRDINDVRYFYDSSTGIIYLSIRSHEKNNTSDESFKSEIAMIDLTGDDYKLNILKEIKVEKNHKWFADSITKLGNYIYFGNLQLYKMNLDNYSVEKMNITSQNRSIDVLGYMEDNLIYNIEKTIYKYNLSTNIKEKIVENASIEYLYGNEFIYTDVSGFDYIYKSYNLDTNKTKQISEDIGRGTLGFSYTVPYQNSYLNLYDEFYYNNDKKFQLSCDNIDIDWCDSFSIESYITYSDGIIVTGVINPTAGWIGRLPIENKPVVINVDLNKQAIKSIKESEELITYRYVTYIKKDNGE